MAHGKALLSPRNETMATFANNMALQAGGTLSGSVPLSDANAQRIIAAYRVILGLAGNSTNQQVWDAITAQQFGTLKQNTMNYERQQQQTAIVVNDIT